MMRIVKVLILLVTLSIVGFYSYSERIKINSHYSAVFYNRAWNCRGKCSLQKQKWYYDKAIYHDPGFADAYFRLGAMVEDEGDIQRALPFYRKAAALDFKHHEAHYKVGLQYYRAHDYERALRHLLVSEQAEPSYDIWHNPNEYHPSTWNNNYYIARIYEKQKNYTLALEHYKTSIAQGGTMSLKSWVGLGVIYHLMGDYRSAASQTGSLYSVRTENGLAGQLDEFIKTGLYPKVLKED